MAQITLAKALKNKKTLAKNISDLSRKIGRYNSTQEGSENPYNTKNLLTDLENTTQKLVNLKIAINTANLAIQGKIYKMAELKSLISNLRNISTASGTVSNDYSEKTIAYKSQITTLELEDYIAKREGEIEALQEEIDNFNYTVKIEDSI
jgi:hypothetical protein